MLPILAAGRSQTGSLSNEFTLVILFGLLGPLIAILIAAWDVWYEHRRCEGSAQGIFLYSPILLMTANKTSQDRDVELV